MFLGVTSSRSSGPSCWRRQRLRNATATARLASSWPTMWSLSAATMALGVSLSFSTSEGSPPRASSGDWGMDAWRFISPAMSWAVRRGSSGAAETLEEALVTAQDALDRRRVGRRIPLIELERAAEDYAVGPREHVAGAAGEGVADIRLRLEDGELAASGAQVLVAEQVA